MAHDHVENLNDTGESRALHRHDAQLENWNLKGLKARSAPAAVAASCGTVLTDVVVELLHGNPVAVGAEQNERRRSLAGPAHPPFRYPHHNASRRHRSSLTSNDSNPSADHPNSELQPGSGKGISIYSAMGTMY